jgi:hypothetical protein
MIGVDAIPISLPGLRSIKFYRSKVVEKKQSETAVLRSQNCLSHNLLIASDIQNQVYRPRKFNRLRLCCWMITVAES